MRQSNFTYSSCYPQTCFFNCGDPQLRNTSTALDDYQLSQLTSNYKRPQKLHKNNHQLELGPSSKQLREPMIKKNKLQSKVSIKERNSQDISKSKKLSLRKSQQNHSKTSSIRKSQTSEHNINKFNYTQEQSDYLHYQHVNHAFTPKFTHQPLLSYETASNQSRFKKQIFAEKTNTLTIIQPAKFNLKKQQKSNKLDLMLKQNESNKNNHLKGRLGQNLPTLRSQYQNTNGPRTERSQVIYHQSKYLH